MLIYNSKEIATRYMHKDDMVVEIHSLLSPEELLTKLRAGEEITPDIANISAFSANNGEVITQAEYITTERKESDYGYDTVLDEDEMEDLEENAEDNSRPKIFQAFEAYQFNNPWRTFIFQPCEITREQLATQLYAALGIMPTIKDIPEKNITELKRMSAAGDRLYWSFADIGLNNMLPSRSDIEFYESLSDYEKRIINESGVHPLKMLDIARGIKEGDPGRLLTITDESNAHILDVNKVINLSKAPGLTYLTNIRKIPQNKKNLSFMEWLIHNKITSITIEEIDQAFENKISNVLSLSQISQKYATMLEEKTEIEANNWKENEIKKLFCFHMFTERVFPEEILATYNDSTSSLVSNLIRYYENQFPNFVKQYIQKDENGNEQGPHFIEEDIVEYAKKSYKKPVPNCIKKADEIFKELFHGHSPRVLSEYMYGQFLAKGIEPYNATEEQIRNIAEHFDQKNVSKVAKYKNLVLFALADKMNFNEVKIEHLQAIAIFVKPIDIKKLIDKGFVEWYLAHKDMSLSSFVEALTVHNQIERFDINKSAKDLVEDIYFKKGKADCTQMERKYGYRFADNELAIRGRHVVAQEGKTKMYMLQKNDYRNFTVGYDTHCCQHLGDAGESCVYKLTSDPFAGCVVIERDGNILAQGFIWTDEAQDTLVFDNVEFADDRKIEQFSSLFAAWSRAMPYKNIHVGVGYNQGMHAWGKKITYQAILPTTLDGNTNLTGWGNGNCYSDYHNDARSLKMNGNMQISEKNAVKVTTKPDEPTRWDVLARPETAFLLNDWHASIESRLEFARNFLNEQTPDIQLEAVKRNVLAIKYIENPTGEVQTFVVNKDPKHATLIKNPCREVQKILLDMDSSYIRNIQNPDEDMAIQAVKHNGLLLGEIQNPSEVVKRVAVEENGYAIRFIDNPSEALQLSAVRCNPKVVSLLRNPSENVLRTAVEADASVISLIQRPSEELQLFAVEKNPYVINNIANPSYNAVKRAVEKEGLLIRNFQYDYPHLKLTALRQNGFVIRVINNPTAEEYIEAVKQNRSVANIIRDPELRSNIELAIIRENASQVTRNEENEMELE